MKVIPNRSGLTLDKSRKLSPRFCGPFEILKRIEKVAYELKLPEDWKIHNVFHVCLLRKYMSIPNYILVDRPKAASKEKFLAEPEKILKIEYQYLRNRMFHRFYVNWRDYPEKEASWEREIDFRNDYPNFLIENNDFNGRERL